MQKDKAKEASYHSAVIVDPEGSPTYQGQQSGQRWSWRIMIASAFSIICCTCIGLSALVTAMTAYTDHKVRDFAGADRKNRRAKKHSIVAIVIGSIIVAIYIGLIILGYPVMDYI